MAKPKRIAPCAGCGCTTEQRWRKALQVWRCSVCDSTTGTEPPPKAPKAAPANPQAPKGCVWFKDLPLYATFQCFNDDGTLHTVICTKAPPWTKDGWTTNAEHWSGGGIRNFAMRDWECVVASNVPSPTRGDTIPEREVGA